jgi:hypothetical protein
LMSKTASVFSLLNTLTLKLPLSRYAMLKRMPNLFCMTYFALIYSPSSFNSNFFVNFEAQY